MQHKIGLYIRVSTEEQALRSEGWLENQKHRLQSFVEVKNMSDPFGNIIAQFTTGNRIWTKLDIEIVGGSEEKIKFAFEQLQKRIKQFEDYDKK